MSQAQDKIQEIQAQLKPLEEQLVTLWRQERDETRILSDEDRIALVRELFGSHHDALSVEDLIEDHLVKSLPIQCGWEDQTDEDLLIEVVFRQSDDPENPDLREVFSDFPRLAENPGAVAALGRYMAERARTPEDWESGA